MTAVNVMLQDKQAFVMTDTLAYGATDGIPHSFHIKAIAVSGCRVVVASRGHVGLTNAFAQAFPEVYDDIDHAVADGFDVLKQIYEIHLAADSDPDRQPFCDIIFVGWSDEQNRPIGFYLARRDEWEMHEIDPTEGLQAPALMGADMEAFAEQAEVEALDWDVGSFDPRQHGLLLLEAQRRVKFEMPGLGLPPMNLIGGQIHLTTVTSRGVVQETLHDWNDALGVAVTPAPYAGRSAAHSAALDRAAAKRARKAAKLAKVAA